MTKLSSKLAAKVAMKLGTKYAAKGLAGFVPFFGAAAGAGINAYIVKSMAASADCYYANKRNWISWMGTTAGTCVAKEP